MKRVISILSVMLLVVSMFAMTASAEATTASGFYNIGTKENVVTTPYAADEAVTATVQDMNGDNVDDNWYIDSDRIEVSYSAAIEDRYYGVILVEGSGVPTKDSEIYYIDQVTAESATVDFDVFPILPEETTDLTMYISSDVEDFNLISIPLNYAVDAAVKGDDDELKYTLGDIDNDGAYGVKDALLVLQIGTGKYTANDAEKAAADVDLDGVYGVKDALLILQYGTGKISSFPTK